MRGPNLDKLKNWGIFTVISATAGLIENWFLKSNFITDIALINALSFGTFTIRIATKPDTIDGQE
jgi:EamA domain-containing membrane protein RarD